MGRVRKRLGGCLAGLVICLAAQAQPGARPFRAGENLQYRVSFGVLGGGTGALRVDAGPPIRGESTVRLSFQFQGRAGPFQVRHHSRSWLSERRWASLRYEVDEEVPIRPVFERVELFPDEQRWSALKAEGGSITDEPVDELSFLFLLRGLELNPGDTHSLNRHYDAGRNPVIIRVLEHQRVRVPAGEFDTTVVELRVRDPNRCGGKGVLRVYVSADAARLPVKMVSACPVQMTLELASH